MTNHTKRVLQDSFQNGFVLEGKLYENRKKGENKYDN